MYCVKCGNKLEDQDLFCNKCGTRTDVQEETIVIVKEEVKEKMPIKLKKALTLGIISMVFGILSVAGIFEFFGIVYGIIAIVLSTYSKKAEENVYSSVGKVCGIVGICVSCYLLLHFVI